LQRWRGGESLSGHSAISYLLRAWVPAKIPCGGIYIEASFNPQPPQGEPHAHHRLATWRSNQRDIDPLAVRCFLDLPVTGNFGTTTFKSPLRAGFFAGFFIHHLLPIDHRRCVF
jgi:hypothetical protein